METLTIQSQNRLNHGDMISQEVPSSLTGYRRWIAIYPLTNEPPWSKFKGFKYRIIDFELDALLIDQFFGEEDKKSQREYLVMSDNELLKLIENLGFDVRRFDAPWKNDYPL